MANSERRRQVNKMLEDIMSNKLVIKKEDIEDIAAIEEEITQEEVKELVEQEKASRKSEWDIPKDEENHYFDPNLSYELTGYKPITRDKGLDFRPEWFCEARNNFLNTGHYCQYPGKTKAYNDFWKQELIRCKYGCTINGYT